MYIAILFIIMLAYDVYKAMWFTDANGTHFGIGLGTIIMTVNVFLLSSYALPATHYVTLLVVIWIPFHNIQPAKRP